VPEEVNGDIIVHHKDRERPVLVQDVCAGGIPRFLKAKNKIVLK